MSRYDFTGVGEWNKITGWFDLAEAIAMQTAVKQLPAGSKLVELGSFQGKSSVAIASVMPADSILYSVDNFESTVLRSGETRPPIEVIVQKNLNAFNKNIEAFGVKEKIQVLVMNTTAAAAKFEPECFDLILIDADHKYEPVKSDLENWYPKLKPGGFLFCDDYGEPNFPGVARAIHTFGLIGELVAPSLWFHRKPLQPAAVRIDTKDTLENL